MCRILAYLGEPLSLDGPLFAAENSLVGQSVSPRLMSLLNIGGFGLVAWEAASREPERPYTYRTPGVLGDGNTLIAVRFCFDYGWYRADQSFFDVEREFDFTSLWFALGKSFAPAQDGWDIRFDQGAGAAFIASEPLGKDTTGWLEVPEYSMAVLTGQDGGVTVEVRELAG
jgi:predicted glutamine amidotransferase